MFGDNGDDICGAYIQIRSKADKLAIWTTDATHKDRILGIGYILIRQYLSSYKQLYDKIFLPCNRRLFKEKLFPGSGHDKPPIIYEV